MSGSHPDRDKKGGEARIENVFLCSFHSCFTSQALNDGSSGEHFNVPGNARTHGRGTWGGRFLTSTYRVPTSWNGSPRGELLCSHLNATV
jgi:hypothetical protein